MLRSALICQGELDRFPAMISDSFEYLDSTGGRFNPCRRRNAKCNSTWGCPQIADQINLAFGTSINKDVVRRILALHYQPPPNVDGPSWLTFLGHTKDSLWSLDLFCCESMTLRTHWVLVVMDHYTRRIIGFGESMSA